MGIEISSGGVSKKYRYYPYDAFYVDANGNINTNGDGEQVREAYFNGTKYYPESGDDVATYLCQSATGSGSTWYNVTDIDSSIYYYPNVTRCVDHASSATPSGTEVGRLVEAGPYSTHCPPELVLPACAVVGEKAFWACSKLLHIDLPTCAIVDDLGFEKCGSLQSVNLPACTTIKQGAFSECTSLSSVVLSSCEDVGGSSFSQCSSLRSIELPSCEIVRYMAFLSCTLLESVELPVCRAVHSYSFRNCTHIKHIALPLCEAVDAAFQNCTSLSAIELPSCMSLYGGAFEGCSSLQTITVKTGCDISYSQLLPSGVEIIYV